jgi:hypothetical protein
VSKGPLASRGYNAHYRYYGADEADKQAEADKHHKSFTDHSLKLKELLEKVDKRSMSTGKMEHPARTCAELFSTWKHLPSGNYFIDPNEGSPSDAILANCNKETMETCVQQDNLEVKNTNFGNGQELSDEYKWIAADIQQKPEIAYQMDVPQMKLLQSLSTQARQTITYHCKNSHALKANNAQYAAPLKLKTDDEEVETLTVKVESRKLAYEIVHDECSLKNWQWRNTTIEVKSQIPEQLPILDVATNDIGGADEEFKLEVGPVCFS